MLCFYHPEIDKCSSHPCQNNAQCEERDPSYVCICRDGYTGRMCETGNNLIIVLLFYYLQVWDICYIITA